MSSQSGTSRAARAVESEPARDVPPPLEPSSILLPSHLQLLDPILQFLTRATGRSLISLATLRRTLPQGSAAATSIRSVPELGRRGIIRLAVRRRPEGAAAVEEANRSGDMNDEGFHSDDMVFAEDEVYRRYDAVLNSAGAQEMQDNNDGGSQNGNEEEEEMLLVGFFPKPGHFNGECIAEEAAPSAGGTSSAKSPSNSNGNGLHGATKTGAKKRLAALRKSLKADEKRQKQAAKGDQEKPTPKATALKKRRRKESPVEEVDDGIGESLKVGEGKDTPTNPLTETQSETVGETDTATDTQSESAEPDAAADTNDDTAINKNNDSAEARKALECYRKLMGIKAAAKEPSSPNFKTNDSTHDDDTGGPEPLMLPGQTVFASRKPAREIRNGTLSEDNRRLIPSALIEAFGLDIGADSASAQADSDQAPNGHKQRRLYQHQATAVESILGGRHTTICTGTGSGKSLCFLLPILSRVMKTDIDAVTASAFSSGNDAVAGGAAAIIIYPTKALAQDQYTKLLVLVNSHPLLVDHVRVGVIDGDTPHSSRADICKHSNIILTNPDTIHAAMLPNWKRTYAPFLARVRFVVVDESHVYEGAFGAHVSLVLSRLVRVCSAAFYNRCDDPTEEEQEPIVFVGCSATIGRPEEHFRLLCPIADDEIVTVLSSEDDASPCAAKYFFTHTPPLLDASGKSTGRLVIPVSKTKSSVKSGTALSQDAGGHSASTSEAWQQANQGGRQRHGGSNRGPDLRRAPMHRRHAADETARLLAAAVRNGVRCIAFCKTRSLCEWVYERCISELRSTSPSLSKKVESYRGGYAAEARRSIEKRLFKEELLAVVATSALELGVDIGGIDLTLHCGYPGSISSLMQQSGRAGRGGKPSASVMICFSSPSEQHFWRYPKTLLTTGLDAPPAVPVNAGLLQNHLLCAGEEYPLVGKNSITTLLTSERSQPVRCSNLIDRTLFAGNLYDECIGKLSRDRLITAGKLTISDDNAEGEVITTYSTHPSVDKPWSRVSLRSIEPISYQIVDLNHNLQGGRTDTINENAVMDR